MHRFLIGGPGPPRRTPIAVQYYITHHTAASRDKTRMTNEKRSRGRPKGSRNKPGAQKTGPKSGLTGAAAKTHKLSSCGIGVGAAAALAAAEEVQAAGVAEG